LQIATRGRVLALPFPVALPVRGAVVVGALACAAATVWLVARGPTGAGATALYLASLLGLLPALAGWPRPARPRPTASALLPFAAAAVYLALASRVGATPSHFHYDEFITAAGSLALPPLDRLDLFAAYPDLEASYWVTQFPSLFFLLQKPLLLLGGTSVESVRWSLWPYHLLAVAYLWLLSGQLLHRTWYRAIALGSFVLLAPNLYLAGMGVHFHSSTAFVLAAVHHAVLATRRRSAAQAVAAGVAVGLCFLTYSSSYLVLPLLLPFCLLGLPRDGGLVARGAAAAAAVLLPFAAYAASWHNYFGQRTGQVGGAWLAALGEGRLSEGLAGMWLALGAQLDTNLRALYRDGVGGVTDYTFGHRALFDPLTLTVLGVGAAAALLFAWRRRQAVYLYPVGAVALAFVVGMVLTLPSGAFHRFSVAFPFVGLLLALGIAAFGELIATRSRRAAAAAMLALALALWGANLRSLEAMLANETPSASVSIARYLAEQVPPGTRIVIAADPVYHLGRELTFRTGGAYRFETAWFADALGRMDGGPAIVFYPEGDQLEQLQRRFPQMRLLASLDGVDLGRYRLLVP
jgi:hypothetical protein